MNRRQTTRPELPRIKFDCGCVISNSFVGATFCPEAARLWDKVNAANHNLTQTRKAVEKWPVTTFHMYGPARIKVREAFYDWRKAEYEAHFGKDTRPVYRRVKRKLRKVAQ